MLWNKRLQDTVFFEPEKNDWKIMNKKVQLYFIQIVIFILSLSINLNAQLNNILSTLKKLFTCLQIISASSSLEHFVIVPRAPSISTMSPVEQIMDH